MKNLFTLFLWFIIVGSAAGQSADTGKITGTVTDSVSGKAVPYATIALKNDVKVLTGTTADGEGTFTLTNLPLGNYFLEITFMGYRSKKMPVKLTTAQATVNLGKIMLSSDSKMLKAVEVTALKALVEDKGDRLVYNAEKDISNAGGTATDVLRKVPTLSVDLNGNVQMRGNSNIKVLVNGKPSAMMARNLADALRQMPANTIKTIEVITSPGAKYDAEGSAGVINIITKKGLQGFNGSTNVTAGDYNRNLGSSLNYRKKKVGVTFSGSVYQYRNNWENRSVRTALDAEGQPQSILNQSQFSDNTGTGANGEMSFDYDPDSTSRINFSANVWGGNFPNDATMQSRLTNPAGGELAAFRNETRFFNPYGNGQLDLGYTKTFKKPEQEFSLLTQFSRMPDNYFYETDIYAGGDLIATRQHSSNYSRNKEYTLQSDYIHPFKLAGRRDTTSLKLEVGAKAIRRDIGSEFRVEEGLGAEGPLLPVAAQSNDFNYFQRVFSGYTSLRLETKNKWRLNAGARLEHTTINGDFRTTGTRITQDYNNLIPSVTIAKTIKKQTFKASYNQRIQRPLIWYLNPWQNRSDTLNVVTGNVNLEPELSHGVELSHNLNTDKGMSLNSSVYVRYTDNAIEYIRTIDAEGVSFTSPKNIAERQAVGLNLNLSGQPNKNWNLNGGTDIQYVDLNSPTQNMRNNGLVWSLNLNSTYKLPKDFTVQTFGNYNSGWIGLQNTNSGNFWHGISAKRELMNKKASLTLGVNNPLTRGIRQTGTQKAPTFVAENRSFFVARNVRLTFEWRFGQMSTDGGKRSKKISNDDKGGR